MKRIEGIVFNNEIRTKKWWHSASPTAFILYHLFRVYQRNEAS